MPGLDECIASEINISHNLVNSGHIDYFDLGHCFAIWVSDKPEDDPDDWLLLLPNVTTDEGRTATAIKLRNGRGVSWPGKDIFHCSSGTPGSNNLYGFFLGMKEPRKKKSTRKRGTKKSTKKGGYPKRKRRKMK